jgi:biopolymer transport protein ExbD
LKRRRDPDEPGLVPLTALAVLALAVLVLIPAGGPADIPGQGSKTLTLTVAAGGEVTSGKTVLAPGQVDAYLAGALGERERPAVVVRGAAGATGAPLNALLGALKRHGVTRVTLVAAGD